MKLTLAAALPLLLAPALARPALAQEGAPQAPPPIQEEGDFYIMNFSENAEDTINLLEFVSVCQEATGRNFTYDDTTRTQLQQKQVFVHGVQRIPKEDFYAYFQILMFIHEFVAVEVGPPHISIVLIQSLGGARAGANVRQRTVHVLPENLTDYSDQPATLITTVLTLPNTDTRTLSTSLRGLLTDTNTQAMIAAGDNSVILQGFGSYIASLAELLYIVDQASAAKEIQPAFEVLPMEYAAAEDVADLLDQLMEARASGNRARAAVAQQQGVSGALLGEDVEPRILVDGRTNSLLVMALPDEIPRIKDLVARLDVDIIEPERNFHIYGLQNVSAEETAQVLDDFLSDAERITRAEGGTGGRAQQQGGASPSSSQSNQVVVVPDPATNALLIAANKTRYDEVLELIRQLDRRQDQVLIETALIELSGTDFRDIGFEWAFADIDDGFGVTNFGLSGLQDTDNDGVPDIRVPLLSDGITAGILSGDDINLPFLVAAIQRVDGANVLNVPSVLVNNNGSALVRTLDEQPTTTITATGTTGQTQENFRDFEEAGITLEISPSISASRYLRLNISLTVSTFTGSFQGGAVPPPRITRELVTTVNVPDGDTMVIGGIITDNITETTRSVPWLGNIPLIRHLFSRHSQTNMRTTLYFFVTPHILQDRDFADLAEISYMKKLQAAEVIGHRRVRVIDPEFGLEGEQTEFEGFEVPLYRSPRRGEVDPESVGLTPERRRELLEGAPDEEPVPDSPPPGDDGSDDG